MRIYEFAQQYALSSKDIIDILQSHGLEAKSHMSVLSDEAISLLEKKINKNNKEVVKTSSSVKVDESVQKVIHDKESDLVSVVQSRDSKKESTVSIVLEQMSIEAFCHKIHKPIAEVMVTLLKWGIVVSRNQVLGEAVIKRLADHYEILGVKPSVKKDTSFEKGEKKVVVGNMVERLPIVVVVGHVDHGKTTLLDYIRKTRVALKEKGGITQHLGAYEASTSHGSIIFLDTPGHEAFGKIRQRGIRVADLVILVVAADDGVKPQTVEAIKYAQQMEAPIIVALNKIDRVDSGRLDVVKQQLSQYNIIVEDWGGDVVCAPISAKLGTGIDHLLEMISLQADIMELRANIEQPAVGYVLESCLEKGRGPVATVITQSGLLKIGQYFSCGNTTGRISSIIDSSGQRIKEIYPSVPAQIAGFDERPEPGDFFEIISKSAYLKLKSLSASDRQQKSFGARFMYQNGINLLVKADNHSSLEAIVDGIDKLSKKFHKGYNILRQTIGDVSESDIEFAYNTGSRIVCFNVKTEANAYELADHKKISILHYGIIYKLLEDLTHIAEELKEVEMVRTKIGEAIVLKVFDIKKIGIIAGSLIKDGRFVRDGFAVIWRGKLKIGEGKIASLQRDKKTVKEIASGFECAFMVNGFSDWLPDDKVECFIDVPKK